MVEKGDLEEDDWIEEFRKQEALHEEEYLRENNDVGEAAEYTNKESVEKDNVKKVGLGKPGQWYSSRFNLMSIQVEKDNVKTMGQDKPGQWYSARPNLMSIQMESFNEKAGVAEKMLELLYQEVDKPNIMYRFQKGTMVEAMVPTNTNKESVEKKSHMHRSQNGIMKGEYPMSPLELLNAPLKLLELLDQEMGKPNIMYLPQEGAAM